MKGRALVDSGEEPEATAGRGTVWQRPGQQPAGLEPGSPPSGGAERGKQPSSARCARRRPGCWGQVTVTVGTDPTRLPQPLTGRPRPQLHLDRAGEGRWEDDGLVPPRRDSPRGTALERGADGEGLQPCPPGHPGPGQAGLGVGGAYTARVISAPRQGAGYRAQSPQPGRLSGAAASVTSPGPGRARGGGARGVPSCPCLLSGVASPNRDNCLEQR